MRPREFRFNGESLVLNKIAFMAYCVRVYTPTSMITRSNPSSLFLALGLAAALATGVLASASDIHAQATATVLHSFGANGDGVRPHSVLIQDADGRLYGTTYNGGANNTGTIFRMAPDGSGYAILHSFAPDGTDGRNPFAGLIQGPDGTLYGTAFGGGASNFYGTVFQMAPDGSGFIVLHSFTGGQTDGAYPFGGLIQGPDGTLYGTTEDGGMSNDGTIFQLAPDGSGYTVLHSLTGTDGIYPFAGLIQGPDGTLSGTTVDGGAGNGTLFQMAPDGSSYSVLHSFAGSPTDGSGPSGLLIQGPDGTLNGTTSLGGANNLGTVFQMAPDGSGFSVLHSFTGGQMDGASPVGGLIQGPDGTLYGTTAAGGTNNRGTIFQMAPDGSSYSVLHSFAGADGDRPLAALMEGADGTLYGTTFYGGASNAGVAFQLRLSPSAPTSGRVGPR